MINKEFITIQKYVNYVDKFGNTPILMCCLYENSNS
jgi:hypothetical protein